MTSNNNKRLEEFLKNGLKEIDSEINQEEDIDKRADYIARQLDKTRKVKLEYNNQVYNLSMKVAKNYKKQELIILMAASETKQRQALLANKMYTPAVYTGEYNDNFTLEENTRTVVKAFLSHCTGNFRVETLEDEGAVQMQREKRTK